VFDPGSFQGQQPLFLVLAINSFGIGIVTLIYVRRQHQLSALRLWALSQLMLAAGLILLAVEAKFWQGNEFFVATGPIFLGLAMQLAAYARYALVATSTHWIESVLIVGLLGLLLAVVMSGSTREGTLVVLFLIAVAQLAFVGVLVLSSRPRTVLLNTLIAAHAASAMAFLSIALEVLGNPGLEIRHETPLHGIVLLLAGLFPYAAGLSFLFLIKEDVDRELQDSRLRVLELNRRHKESERLHAQNLRERELETMAHLSAGVAHDFNNLLGVIRNDTEYLAYHLRQQEQDPSVLDALDSVHSAVGQARIITSGMMVLNRDTELLLEPIELEPVIRELARVLGPMLPDAIALKVQVEPGLWVASSRGFLQASLLNLVTNARDAMPDGGELVIEARQTELEAGKGFVVGEVIPGQKVLIQITDAGTGMPVETLQRIFEPRFTTKRQGAGHGLGLFMVKRFIERAQAAIVVQSSPGQGTTFNLYLPKASRPVATAGGVRGIASAQPISV
jgi:signal transduction histidine kinase